MHLYLSSARWVGWCWLAFQSSVYVAEECSWLVSISFAAEAYSRFSQRSCMNASDELVDIYTTQTKLGYNMQEFSITTLRAYSVYTLTVLSAESERSIGLSYFQIYAKGYYALLQ